MTKSILKNKFTIFILFLLGIIHWLAFFLVVDYYNYNNLNVDVGNSLKTLNYNNVVVSDENKISFIEPISYQYIKDRVLKRDKHLLISFLKNPKLFSLLKYKEFNYSDWYNENNVLRVLKNALQNSVFPYHSSYGAGNTPKNNRFFGQILYSLSPQIILLYFVDIQAFTIINMLIMYTVGFFGCLLFLKRYQLGMIPFSFLLLVFNFNGYFVEKIAAYGAHFMGYFMFPYVFYVILQIIDTDSQEVNKQIKYGICLGLSLVAMLFQGSIHLYVEAITFIILWLLFNFKYWKTILIALMTTFSVGSTRFLPGILTYGTDPNRHANLWGGYSDLGQLFDGLLTLKHHLHYPIYSWWEYSLYISLPAVLILVYYGLFSPFLKYKWCIFNGWKSLVFPLIIITIISFRQWKLIIIPNWIPLLNAESMTSRYMIIPLLLITIITAINLQGFLESYKTSKSIKLLFISLIGMIFIFLMNHSRIWRMHVVQTDEEWHSLLSSQDRNVLYQDIISNPYLIDKPHDSIYFISIWTGIFISVVSLVICLYYLAKTRNSLQFSN